MQIDVAYGPGSSVATIDLEPGESITSEGGAMVAMSGNLQIRTDTKTRGGGGVLKALKRMVSGENFFMNHFSAPAGGQLWLGTTLPGDMMVYELDNETLIVQGGSWVASGENIDVDLSWQGFKSFLSGENLFFLKLKGSGPAIVNSFGAIYPVEVNGDYIVDTGHIVAFNETLDFEIRKAGKSWATAILGGEGLVCRFKGQGTVWCQSHNERSFGRSLGPKLRPRKG